MRRLPLIATFTALAVCSAFATPAHAAWQWPVSGDVITPYRNGTDPYATGQHRGIDIAAPVGAEVRAAAGGEVRFAGTAGSSGLTVSIRTGDGYDTSYLHLSSLAVRAGARVSTGERIGAVGTTGTRSATPPHLHFGVRDAGTRHAYHDPLAFLPPPPTPARPAPPPAPAPEPAAPPPAPAPAPASPAAPPLGAPLRRAPARSRAFGRGPRAVPSPHRVPRTSLAPRKAPAVAPNGAAPGAVTSAPPRATATTAKRTDPRSALDARASAAAGSHPQDSPARGERLSPLALPDPGPRASESASAGDRTTDQGPNLGWALACAGLLLAGGILGLGSDGRGRPTRTRGRLAGVLRPLLGGR